MTTESAAAASPSPSISVQERKVSLLDFCRTAVKINGSDIHLQSGSVPMIRVDPGDTYDGVGWGKLSGAVAKNSDVQYQMWGRKEVFAQSLSDSSLSHPEVLHARIADNGWFSKD